MLERLWVLAGCLTGGFNRLFVCLPLWGLPLWGLLLWGLPPWSLPLWGRSALGLRGPPLTDATAIPQLH